MPAPIVQTPVSHWQTPAFPVDAEKILRIQGYRDPARIRPRVRAIAERAASDIASIAAPQACYTRRAIASVKDGVLELEGGYRFTCNAFDRLLAAAREVVVFLLTLGPEMETEVARRFEASEPVDALFLECAGWLCVEKATRLLAAHIQAEMAGEGLGITFRLGPGYDYKDGDDRAAWGLEEQPELFRVFGEVELPVQLLESCVMMPKLSRSGMFGVTARA